MLNCHSLFSFQEAVCCFAQFLKQEIHLAITGRKKSQLHLWKGPISLSTRLSRLFFSKIGLGIVIAHSQICPEILEINLRTWVHVTPGACVSYRQCPVSGWLFPPVMQTGHSPICKVLVAKDNVHSP